MRENHFRWQSNNSGCFVKFCVIMSKRTTRAKEILTFAEELNAVLISHEFHSVHYNIPFKLSSLRVYQSKNLLTVKEREYLTKKNLFV